MTSGHPTTIATMEITARMGRQRMNHAHDRIDLIGYPYTSMPRS